LDYVIGIDSGGTHYRVLAAGLDGESLGEYSGSPCNHYRLDYAELLCRINGHIDVCLGQSHLRREHCVSLVCGTTGLDSEEDAVFLHRVYGELEGFHCPVTCINDAELALYTVLDGFGAQVISGTGAIAFGRNRQGRSARIGGWHSAIFGDEGSGVWIAKQVLRHLGRWFDGAVPDGPLAEMVRETLGIGSRKALMEYAVRIGAPPWKHPDLGPLADRAAGQGDPYAAAILKNAARETFLLADDLITLLRLHEEGDFNIGLWGGNILNSPRHREAFIKLANEKYPKARIVLPRRSAAQAAAALARENFKGLSVV
jgi:N-acetylglucosamine kinase-like BadF-type ATPase